MKNSLFRIIRCNVIRAEPNMMYFTLLPMNRYIYFIGVWTRMVWNIWPSSSDYMTHFVSPSDIWKISPRLASPRLFAAGPRPTSAIFSIYPRTRQNMSYNPRRKAIYSIHPRLDPYKYYIYGQKIAFRCP